MKDRAKGAHEWLIEFRKPPANIENFNALLDQALQSLNSDYEAKRFNNLTINAPKIHIARHRLFYDWLKQQNKLGGQHKVPRLSNNREYIDQLLKLNFPLPA